MRRRKRRKRDWSSREELGELADQRLRFRGVFGNYGETNPRQWWIRPKTTLLLRNVQRADTGELLTDHIWFVEGKRFARLGNLKSGDVIEFNARVLRYQKRHMDDWGLKYPSGITLTRQLRLFWFEKSGEEERIRYWQQPCIGGI